MELETSVIEQVMGKHQERLECELLGAWRAGYDYVHYYESRMGDGYPPKGYLHPSDHAERLDPDEIRYVTTYVLKDVTREDVEQVVG